MIDDYTKLKQIFKLKELQIDARIDVSNLAPTVDLPEIGLYHLCFYNFEFKIELIIMIHFYLFVLFAEAKYMKSKPDVSHLHGLC